MLSPGEKQLKIHTCEIGHPAASFCSGVSIGTRRQCCCFQAALKSIPVLKQFNSSLPLPPIGLMSMSSTACVLLIQTCFLLQEPEVYNETTHNCFKRKRHNQEFAFHMNLCVSCLVLWREPHLTALLLPWGMNRVMASILQRRKLSPRNF